MPFLWLLLSGIAQGIYGSVGNYTNSCTKERIENSHKWSASDKGHEALKAWTEEEERIRLKYGDRKYYG